MFFLPTFYDILDSVFMLIDKEKDNTDNKDNQSPKQEPPPGVYGDYVEREAGSKHNQ